MSARGAASLLVLAAVAAPLRAGDAREANRIGAQCMREYHLTLRGAGGSIASIRDRLVPVMRDMTAKYKKSLCYQLDLGFEEKYGKDADYCRCLAEILAATGRQGITTLWRRYKHEGKRDGMRLVIVESLGACGDEDALSTLVKTMYDDAPAVAAAAVRGIGRYADVDERERKDVCKKLVRHFEKTTDGAAGKDPESDEMKMYLVLKPAFNETLKAFTGQELDSATAWDSWLRENVTKPWPDRSDGGDG